MHNNAIESMDRFTLAKRLIWNTDVMRELREMVAAHRIEVVHFHNTFPLISPAAYYAAKNAGAGVVHTLHNFRLVCPGALLLREGRVCEECLGKLVPWRAVANSCYRDSTLQSAGVSLMLTSHRLIGTWDRKIDTYIALSEFARDKFIQGGLPAARISVKPNFVDSDPGAGRGGGGYALFVGRLSTDKGIDTLLRAWKTLGPDIPLKIAGDGPMAPDVRTAAATTSGIEYLGRQTRERVFSLMSDAAFLVFPSIWYEGFPMTIVEAYASALPVVASNLGSMASIVKHGITGLHFSAGDVPDLQSQVRWLQSHPNERQRLRANARQEFTDNYSPDRNYEQLMRIYGHVRRGAGEPQAMEVI